LMFMCLVWLLTAVCLLDRSGDPAHCWKRMKMDKRTRHDFVKCCMLKIVKASSVF